MDTSNQLTETTQPPPYFSSIYCRYQLPRVHSLGNIRLNEYGAMVEWYWQGKLKYCEKNIKQCGWLMNEWVWSNGGMILTGENWSTGRETLYSVGGWWMNEYGQMMEGYWQGKTEVLREKHYTACVVDDWMSMEQWWNDTDRGKLKYWEKNIIQRGW